MAGQGEARLPVQGVCPWYHKLVFPVRRQKGRYRYYILRENGRAPWSLGIYQMWLDIYRHVTGVSSPDHQKFNSLEEAVKWFKLLHPNVKPRVVPEGEDPWAQMPVWEAERQGSTAVPPPIAKKQRPQQEAGAGDS